MSVSPETRTTDAAASDVYQGFWQAGFEGDVHVNGSAVPLCMNIQTAHLRNASRGWKRSRTRYALRSSTRLPSTAWASIRRWTAPDWEQPQRWHQSGLWRVRPVTLRRRRNHPYATALSRARSVLA